MTLFNPTMQFQSTSGTLLVEFLHEAKDIGAEIAYGGSVDKKSLRMEPTSWAIYQILPYLLRRF